MGDQRDPLSVTELAIVSEEEELLQRVQRAISAARSRARPGGDDVRATSTVRQLRAEAQETQDEDLPDVLHELGVRQQLRDRPAAARLPDAGSPYLAHLRVDERGTQKDYLLGADSFVDTAAGVRIVDWRAAPVAQLFHRYRTGDEYEEAMPGRTAEGFVAARRMVVIAGGRLIRIIDDSGALARGDDGTWRAEAAGSARLAAGGAGAAARTGIIAASAAGGPRTTVAIPALDGLDDAQRAAVDTPPDRPLLVLGSAGSGKTTVALHRLARIAATDPLGRPLGRMKVVVPEEGLARLSQRLLEPLGIGAAEAQTPRVQTIDAWAIELAAAVFRERLRLCMDAPGLVVALKRHAAFYHAVRERFADVAPAQATLRRMRRRLAELTTDRGFLAGVIAAAGGELSAAAIEATVAHTMQQLAEPIDRLLATITDAERKQALDGRPIDEGTPDALAGTLDVEDLPILVGLRAWRAGLRRAPLAHLVLDEAEDFGQFELLALGKLLGDRPSVTLAGDEAQQTLSSFAGWEPALATLLEGRTAAAGSDPALCRLTTSYRCPRPVVEVARAILGPLSVSPDGEALAARDGAPVGRFHFPDAAQAELLVTGAIRDLVAREPDAAIAVIARDDSSARRLYALLADVPEARLVLDGGFGFEPGVDVTEVDSVKGLEWDYVIVPDATASAYPPSAESRRRLHVAVTRTSYQLWLVSSGVPSPILEAGVG